MERPCKKVKIIDEIQSDWLSNLPDHIIHHILSLMDTKFAVGTCVLSKNWRYYWTNIHTLSFCRSSFVDSQVFYDFITHVLHHRNHLKLLKLEIDCSKSAISDKITSLVFEYAISHGFEELDTNMIYLPKTLFRYKSLKTLKTVCYFKYSCFATLTTLELYYVMLDPKKDTFAGCLNLQNLQLIQCDVEGVSGVYNISAPRLLTLQISDFLPSRGRIVIKAPRLKFFTLNAINPPRLSMDRCRSLEKVNVHLFPFMDYDDNTIFNKFSFNHMAYYDDKAMQYYVFRMRMIAMCRGISRVKSLTLSLNLSHQETWKEKLVFAFHMDEDFDRKKLGRAVAEIASEELSDLQKRLLEDSRSAVAEKELPSIEEQILEMKKIVPPLWKMKAKTPRS
ncbi:hypothetical protein Ddye_010226 [Dipteronia dyeriana]|uniref:F-box domain-containing protein n=1 Tax=Dipteronia dyeriana TaxID=168575 RepID=A0AAE0CN45_9ROSI|nr:hypothetical protein Ddye_010226 [Dipteronia dyeriana]